MATSERPGPAFVALRAAALGIDDLSRQALRIWVMEALDHRGQPLAEWAPPTEPATQVIVAGVLALPDRERSAFRLWLGRWTDYTGRIITPQEHQRRIDALQLERNAEPDLGPTRQ